MAMFKGREDELTATTSGGETMNTIIGKGTVFSGTMNVEGTLRIDGTLKGEVNVSDTIAIGPTGEVEANVKTKNAVISGSVKGNIHATERVELQAKANIMGDLVTKSLVIEQGAVFHGNCKMGDAPPSVSGQRPQAARPQTAQPGNVSKAPALTAEKAR